MIVYTCDICNMPSEAGAKLLRHIVRAPILPKGSKIVRELKCCGGCKAELDAGQPWGILRARKLAAKTPALLRLLVTEEPFVGETPTFKTEPICFKPVMLLGKKVTAKK